MIKGFPAAVFAVRLGIAYLSLKYRKPTRFGLQSPVLCGLILIERFGSVVSRDHFKATGVSDLDVK